MREYVTKTSGTRAEHPDGVVRDTSKGKPRFDLMFAKGVPFEKQLFTRVADLYRRGGEEYGDRNWENSETEETLAHHEAALMRHVVKFLTGVKDGEDHAAALVWNANAVDLTRAKIQEKRQEGKEQGQDGSADYAGKPRKPRKPRKSYYQGLPVRLISYGSPESAHAEFHVFEDGSPCVVPYAANDPDFPGDPCGCGILPEHPVNGHLFHGQAEEGLRRTVRFKRDVEFRKRGRK